MVNFKERLFSIISFLAIVLIITELSLNLVGTRLCETEGCELVAKQVRFGDWVILLLGLLIFLTIFLTHRLSLKYVEKDEIKRKIYNEINNYVIIIALACEGFFSGYQAFRLFMPCYFCLIVFGIIVLLAIVKLLMGNREMLAGFGALIGVFLLFYIVLPVSSPVEVPKEPVTLFYSENCKHCRELIKELEEKHITINHILVDNNPFFLKNVGITQVPVLFLNLQGEKRFIIGKVNIKNYLFPQEVNKETKKKAIKKTKQVKNNSNSSLLDFMQLKSPLNVPEGACDEEKEDCD
jgi:glutaredoxin